MMNYLHGTDGKYTNQKSKVTEIQKTDGTKTNTYSNTEPDSFFLSKLIWSENFGSESQRSRVVEERTALPHTMPITAKATCRFGTLPPSTTIDHGIDRTPIHEPSI